MKWWYKVTKTDGRHFLQGPFDDESAALADQTPYASYDPDSTLGTPFEGQDNENETWPRGMSKKVLSDGSREEVWSDGSVFPVE